MKITIITASYNAVKTIEQTILSVVHQDYPNLEYIIVDGGSTDGTVDIIRKYESYGIKWISESDEGLYDALNKGVQIATGDYIEIIGADDALVSSDIISRVVRQLGPCIDVLCGQVWAVDEISKKQGIYTNLSMRDQEMYHGGMTPHIAMFTRKDLLLRYPFDTSYRIAADYKFFLQCYYDKQVQMQYIDEIVAFFSVSGMSSNDKACWLEDNRIYQELEIPFHAPDGTGSLFKRKIKQGLIAMKIFMPIRSFWEGIKRNFLWKKHVCDNKICRWCGRVERD